MAATLSFATLFTAFPSSSNPSPRRLHSWNSTRSAGTVRATMNQKTDTPSLVKIAEGHGGLHKVCVSSIHGSEAEIYLFGACITSWKPSNCKDLLFVRPDAVFDGKKPISGGIPHCFPQFGPGVLQQHGFARNLEWSLLDSGSNGGEPVVTLELKDGLYSRSMWDFGFQALYKLPSSISHHSITNTLIPTAPTLTPETNRPFISKSVVFSISQNNSQVKLSAKGLSTALTITNTDKKPFSFTTALHTYFRASISGVSVKGLKGCKTLNKDPDPVNPVESTEERDVVSFPGFVDCIYLDAPDELQLENGLGDTITIRNTNWPNVVLWNPHKQMEASYRDFVCVENAQIGKVQLDSGKLWVAEQHISSS